MGRPRMDMRGLGAVLLLLGAVMAADPPKPPEGIHLPPGQVANWTWVTADPAGMRWDIEANGSVSDGQNDAYDGGMRLQINDNDFQWGEQGRMSADGREVEVGPFSVGGVQVSRRIYIDNKAGYARWIDIFENSTSSAQSVNLRYMTTQGGGNKDLATVTGKAAIQPADWAFVLFHTGDSRPAVLHVIGDKNARNRPQVELSNGNRTVNYKISVSVPAGKAAAVCLFQAQRPAGTAKDELKKFKIEDELRKIPAPLRRILVNVGGGGTLSIGDIDLPRHDTQDMVVLRNEDELLGTILNPQYQVETPFGPLTLPAQRVLGLTADPKEERVRLVLVDAQVVVGKLPNQPIRVRLANGNEMTLPPGQIRTASYSLATDRPKEIAARGSFVILRAGDRLMYRDGAADLTFQSEYGQVKLAGEYLSAIALDTPDNGLHRALFRNGSVLSGLLLAEQFQLPLQLGPTLTVRRGDVERLAFNGLDDSSSSRMVLRLRNDDELIGSLADADLPVETPFGRVTVATKEIVEATFVEGPPGRVQIKTLSGTTISGKLLPQAIRFQIEPGPVLPVYVGHIVSIANEKAPPAGAAKPGPAGSTTPGQPTVGPPRAMGIRRVGGRAVPMPPQVAEMQAKVLAETAARDAAVKAEAEKAAAIRAELARAQAMRAEALKAEVVKADAARAATSQPTTRPATQPAATTL